MAELYEDWIVSKMTRDEFNELSEDEKKERKRLQNKNKSRKYRENNPEKVKEQNKKATKKYYQENKEEMLENNRKYKENNKEKQKEYFKKYHETPHGKKLATISSWNFVGLQETQEDLDRIYDMWLYQEFCNACDVKLTRNSDNHPTQACMDHCHTTHRFRHIICRDCNNQDRWMNYFC